MRKSLRLCVLIATVLLCASLALPAAAAPAAASEEPGLGSKIFDCAVLRPIGFVTTLVGGVLFVPAALLSAPSGETSIKTAWTHFVLEPVESTFDRPLGDF